MTIAKTPAYQPETHWGELHRSGDGLTVVGYPGLGLAFNRWQYRARLVAFRRLLAKPALWPARQPRLETLRVLDGAFGVGAYAQWFGERGVERYVGIDLSDAAVARGRERFPDFEFLQSDLAELGGEQRAALGRFDIVTAVDVLYHIVDDERCRHALHNLAACVDRNGVLIFSDILPGVAYDAASHVRRRSQAFYRTELDHIGFELVALQPVHFTLGDPIPSSADRLLYAFCQSAWRPAQKLLRLAETRPGLQTALGHGLGLPYFLIDCALQRFVSSERVALNLVAARRKA